MTTNDQGSAGFEEHDLISLGEKLASLELTEPERAALSALITDDDVGGFGRFGARFDVIGGIRKGMGIRLGMRVPDHQHGVRAKGVRANWGDSSNIA